ncbi:methyl-accepting chemotaxis protein [Tumebacillus sp. BK434]|uniref:methyl-accepting chemotaxis protein n=1 Tax=Tumebacillus sp. BK434 TaxID=2512169 RepID=UPI0010441509|nr:HAMP domain-containing methyl-accepting chemotaxis protein [Tumebacillus sp. BK434]TCP57816.1 methyl-accepting chemotaxis protein [Tumebacillus sp. BK434]
MVKKKRSKGVSVQTRLTLFVSALLLLVVLAMGGTVYAVLAKDLKRSADFQLQGHAAQTAKQVGILLQTSDSRMFEREATYVVENGLRSFEQIGWHVQSTLLRPDGEPALERGNALQIGQELKAKIIQQKSGILQSSDFGTGNASAGGTGAQGDEGAAAGMADGGFGAGGTYAFEFVPERNLVYVAAVSDEQIFASLTELRNLTLLLAGAALVIGNLGVWFYTRKIQQSLLAIRKLMREVAGGKLHSRYGSRNDYKEITDLGEAVNSMIDNLHRLIGQVGAIAGEVAVASQALSRNAETTSEGIRHVAATIQEVASGADAQAESAVESAGAMDAMAHEIARIVKRSHGVAAESAQTAQEAEQGNLAIQQTIRQMNFINQTAGTTAQAVQALEKRSQQVGKIVEVITGIAAQTNLLALNASIEAARAGEHGKGFAVVADEVSKLALQSQGSARQITELIREMQAETQRVVQAMGAGSQEVQAGIVLVDRAGETFQRILQAAEHVAVQVQKITNASQEMSRRSEEVAAGVDVVKQISQESAASSQLCAEASVVQLASMEDVFASADRLRKMAAELQRSISRFQVEAEAS